ncbi:MAG: hypothetical protein ACI9HK_004515, partial [Pirellulaceae bacterium]
GTFDTADDDLYDLDFNYEAGELNLSVSIVDGPLFNGDYRLAIDSSVTDLVGNQLSDGTGYILTFSVAAVGDEFVFEGRNNNAEDTAATLALSPDPNGTGLFRTEKDGRGSIDNRNDIDYFKFHAESGDLVAINVTQLGPLYSRVTLLAADGSRLASDYSGGPGETSFISGIELADSGEYFLEVAGNFFGGRDHELGDYQVRIDLARGAAMESDSGYSNDRDFQANPLAFTTDGSTDRAAVAGAIMAAENSNIDEDIFALGQIQAGKTVLLSLATPAWSELLPIIEVRDANQTLVSVASAPAGAVARADITELGNYFVTVVASGGSGANGQYLLDVAIQDTSELNFADLAISSVTAPSSADSNETISVTWSGGNFGAIDLVQSTWTDRVYLSADQRFDVIGDIPLRSVSVTESLAVGETYTRSADITLPGGIGGEYYLFVRTDANDDVPEFIFESNNETSADAPLQINRLFADFSLLDASTTTPQTRQGSPVSLEWTMQNVGQGGTVADFWTDGIVVSLDDVYGNEDDTLIGEIRRAGPVEVNGLYVASAEAILPGNIPVGMVKLFVVANIAGLEAEDGQRQNNVSAALTVDVTASAPMLTLVLDQPSVGEGLALNGQVTRSRTLVAITTTHEEQATSPHYVTIAANETSANFTLPITSDQIPEQNTVVGITASAVGFPDSEQATVIVIDDDLPLLEVTFATNSTIEGSAVVGLVTRQTVTDEPQLVEISSTDPSHATVSTPVVIPAGTASTEFIVLASDNNIVEGNTVVTISAVPAYPDGELISVPQASSELTIIDNESILPDLVVTNVSVTDQALFSDALEVTWTVRNDGDGATFTNLTDILMLEPIQGLQAIRSQLGSFVAGSRLPLAVGESYTRTETVTLPLHSQNPAGGYFVTVETNAGAHQPESNETNNQTSSNLLSLTFPPLPDLVVTSIETTSESFSGQDIEVRWTILNQGQGTASGEFSESVGLDSDGILGDDQTLGSFTFAGEIPAGESVTRVQTISLPPYIDGVKRIAVGVNTSNTIFEGSQSNNNDLLDDQTLTIEFEPLVNLQVTEIIAPSQVFTEQTTTLDWVVTNTGDRATSAPSWTDQVWLSQDNVVDPVADRFLGSAANLSYLAPGESYRIENFEVFIPHGINGNWYFLVTTDSDQRVREFDAEDDNNAIQPTLVELTPTPDLQVTSVEAPELRISGESMSISYTVTNRGLGDTLVSRWTDRVFVSTDEVLGAGDSLLAELPHDDFLLSGESYERQANFVVPVEISGDVFFIVQTDVGNSVIEHALEFNNTGFNALHTHLLQGAIADLEVVSVVVPESARAGEPFNLQFEVANLGQDATLATSWVDRAYLSYDAILDTEADIFIGEYRRSASLAAGDGFETSYVSDISALIPNGMSGEFYLLFETDALQEVIELDDSNNLYYATQLLDVRSRPADLIVTEAAIPTSVRAGTSAIINWTVRNQGTGDTIVEQWTDRVVLLSDSNPDSGNAIYSQDYVHVGLIEPAANFETVNQLITFPRGISPGDYHLLIQTDSKNNVYEAGDEDNNWITVPITVVRPAPDLEVSSVSSPAAAAAGGAVPIQWKVTNIGNEATSATRWHDNLYLSRDGEISRDDLISGEDILLGRTQRNNPLGAGRFYNQESRFAIPLEARGPYFVVAITDTDHQVAEFGSESNNTLQSITTINISPFDFENPPERGPQDPPLPRPP